ncbi:MAG: amidohydrolase [Nitrospinae bacterium]|nr:amidohydrolase [Nitrospinota bacterium]
MAQSQREAKRVIIRAVDRMADGVAEVGKEIFAKPELGYRETFAKALLVEKLAASGYRITSPAGGLATAFIARKRGAGKGPRVALIAEYDALPMGHACGHNLIAASAYGAAAALAASGVDMPGEIMVIGTPAEEGGGGKIRMIKNGVFRGVDAALMAHPSNKTRVINRMYAVTSLTFTFSGRASHAAAFPDQGVNALDAGVTFYNAVSALRQQMKDQARVHGIFRHGGDAPNIIPDKVVMEFYVRALTREYFADLTEKVIRAARGAARSAGCTVAVKRRGHSYDPFYPNYPMGEAFRRNMEALGLAEEGFNETEEIGSSDIGNVSQAVPCLHPEYAVGGREDINHSTNFLKAVVSREGIGRMLLITKAVALTAYDLLTDRALMERVKNDFKRQRG